MTDLMILGAVTVAVSVVVAWRVYRDLERAVALQDAEAMIAQIRANYVRLQINIQDNVTPALRNMARALADLQPAMRNVSEAMARAFRERPR